MQKFFQNSKKVALTAIPIGFVGGMLVAVGAAVDVILLLVVGIALLMVSGIMWMLYGIYEDKK